MFSQVGEFDDWSVWNVRDDRAGCAGTGSLSVAGVYAASVLILRNLILNSQIHSGRATPMTLYPMRLSESSLRWLTISPPKRVGYRLCGQEIVLGRCSATSGARGRAGRAEGEDWTKFGSLFNSALGFRNRFALLLPPKLSRNVHLPSHRRLHGRQERFRPPDPGQ